MIAPPPLRPGLSALGPPILAVAGTHSGCGKTSVALGLMRAFSRRGLTVQAFKAGPDFIDPSLHALATGRPSWNLDSWMCQPEALWQAVDVATASTPEIRTDSVNSARTAPPFVSDRHQGALEATATHARADLCILEGVMGLHDGASAVSARGSTAELARLLDARILLVADVKAMARSAAALVHGYTQLEPGLSFAGVALNRVGSDNHKQLLKQSLQRYCPGLPVLGMLRREETITLPARHLGLVTGGEGVLDTAHLDRLADWIEAGCDLDALLQRLPPRPLPSTRCEPVTSETHVRFSASTPVVRGPAGPPGSINTRPHSGVRSPSKTGSSVRIGLAQDAAFCFIYEETLHRLRTAGAEIVPFSPLQDGKLPADIQGLYLPGGYPELHAERLTGNQSLRRAVHAFSKSGMPVYAECGGFMYLMDALHVEGREWPMAGLFPVAARMGKGFAALGYREVTAVEPTFLGEAGARCRGHEFHYSHILDATPLDAAAQQVYLVQDRTGAVVSPATSGGWRIGNTIGSYIHLHFASNPNLAASFVDACAQA